MKKIKLHLVNAAISFTTFPWCFIFAGYEALCDKADIGCEDVWGFGQAYNLYHAVFFGLREYEKKLKDD